MLVYFLYVLAAIGAYATLIFLYFTLRSPFQILWSVVFGCGKTLSQKYGPWAVITGSTDGIGKQYAINLARQGMNVFLLSRSGSKLEAVAQEIRSQSKVEVRWKAIDFADGFKVYDTIERKMTGLDVGVLVNNVGVLPRSPLYFERLRPEEIQQTLAVNISSALMMTRIILPAMKARRRGIVVNVSSASGLIPWPLIGLYSGSKGFLNNFTSALQQELRGTGVQCQLVTPMYVATNLIDHFPVTSFLRLFRATVVRYGRQATWLIGKTDVTTGYWYHAVQVTLLKLIPVEFLTRMSYYQNRRDFLKNSSNVE
ncbi:very-long-chain 3-oxoacyl-CoA reductase-A-like [Uranotaenia lowii]|uniref:very-long-chain 3-oxoacyl-CoA reductase-A-like n=1 Tax=Uranotaenia lowii TaxID=190385 RepID=UPI002478BAF2|nr:very-long-chain 3-oxoacyl-CoA reductase-A-like [Uranotaenia lowii]